MDFVIFLCAVAGLNSCLSNLKFCWRVEHFETSVPDPLCSPAATSQLTFEIPAGSVQSATSHSKYCKDLLLV